MNWNRSVVSTVQHTKFEENKEQIYIGSSVVDVSCELASP